MRPLEVVVRGHARSRYPAERANISLAANLEGKAGPTPTGLTGLTDGFAPA